MASLIVRNMSPTMRQSCGMRLGEIIGLSKKDINLSTCCIHIRRQWLEKEKQYGPPKHGKMHYIRFNKNSELFELLSKSVSDDPDNKVLFHGSNGGRLGVGSFQASISKS